MGSTWQEGGGRAFSMVPYASPELPSRITTFTLFSDVRLKRNVSTLEGSLDKLLKLRGVTFEWKDPAKHVGRFGVQTGFIAQEVEKVFPDWVDTNRTA